MNIKAHIEVAEPGQAITLYEGQLRVFLDEKDEESDLIDNGKIIFKFFPKPRLEFYLKIDADTLVTQRIFDRQEPFFIKLPRHDVLVEVQAIFQSHIRQSIIAVQINKIKWELDKSLSEIVFYLPNFHNYQRKSSIKLTNKEYRITIIFLNHRNKIQDFLNYSGNYAITNICRIEQINSQSFNLNTANNLIKGIYYFFSFCRGLWIAPILMHGFDEKNNLVWEDYPGNVDSWQFTRSWLPITESTYIEKAFSGFWNRWYDDQWREIIELAIYWYVEVCKQSGNQEGSIILAQAALEMLANVVLVEDRKIVSAGGFNQLNAKDKISLLLNQCSIPLNVPSDLNELSKYAKGENWSSGTQAITELRNKLIHPKLTNRQKFLSYPSEVVADIYLLSKWYLELVLLYIFDYEDNYINHTKPQPYLYVDGEPVPWKT